MSDLVKRERREEVSKVGSQVSVPNTFFDIDGSEFSALLPPDLHQLHGTVSYFLVPNKQGGP